MTDRSPATEHSPATQHSTVADRSSTRLIGPDVVRAVALIGVVFMNFYGYLIGAGGERSTSFWGRQLDPWAGPLATRFAATFVLTAGVGTTLLTRSALGDPTAVAARRWTLLRRGLLLYGFGLIAYDVWPGSILPYYGGMFFLAAFLFALPSLALAAVGLAAVLGGAAVNWWYYDGMAQGSAPRWIHAGARDSPRQLILDLFVNGTHPLLPWMAFFCAGMILGRVLRAQWWRPLVLGAALTVFGITTLLSDELRVGSTFRQNVFTLDPRQTPGRGLLYTFNTLSAALLAFVVVFTLATRFAGHPLVRWLGHAGQMTLTIYVSHIVVFNFLVHWQGWVAPGGLPTALAFTAVFWVIAIAAGALWHRRFGIGPLEWLYRKLSA